MTSATFTVDAIDHLVLNVADVEASAAWYERVLGMTRRVTKRGAGEADRTSVFFGDNKINLRPVSASQEDWFTGVRPQPGSDDLCFLTSASPEQVVAHLRECDIAIVRGPVTRQGTRGDICSVYVRDPDGNLIEISSYR